MGATQSVSKPFELSTKKGNIRGIQQYTLDHQSPVLNRYTRIPYALPPLGHLRWRRPQPIALAVSLSSTPFSHTYDVSIDHTAFGPECPQPSYNTRAVFRDDADLVSPDDFGQDEDCLYLNIWTPPPSSPAPKNGWPVQFHIHGGWLQIGNANQDPDHDPFDLFANSNFAQRIIVAPTYRLNVFGFAAGKHLAEANSQFDEKAGNFGLWDQRAALEWVHANISLFGGNPDLITVGGLSAGSHSAFLQLYYDTHLPTNKRIVKQAYLWSNAHAVQPNSSTNEKLSEQWSELYTAAEVGHNPNDSAHQDTVEKLRQVSYLDLVAVIPKLAMHTFRSSTDGPFKDGGFVPSDFLASLHDGSFASRLAENGTRIMLGEVKDEALLYKVVNPPTSRSDLTRQLGNYYPPAVVDALLGLDLYNVPRDDSNAEEGEWANVFAAMVADVQVHASIRGLVQCLTGGSEPPPPPPPAATSQPPSPPPMISTPTSQQRSKMTPQNLFRYKISWRAKGLDAYIKPEFGVCHAMDTLIWWASGWRSGYNDADKKIVEQWLRPFERFLYGEQDIGWYDDNDGDGDHATNTVDRVNTYRHLDETGHIKPNTHDQDWHRALQVYECVKNGQSTKNA